MMKEMIELYELELALFETPVSVTRSSVPGGVPGGSELSTVDFPAEPATLGGV